MNNQSQSSINFPLQTSWFIRRPYFYRMLEKKYVDQFFADGSLRISSFEAFRIHDNEQKKDINDGGYGVVAIDGIGQNEMNEGSVIAGFHPTNNCYVMSGSTIFCKQLQEKFSYDSGFRINDTTLFAAHVSRQIQGFFNGVEGHCIYRKNRQVTKRLAKNNPCQLIPDDTSVSDVNRVTNLINQEAGEEMLFLKEANFQNQSEYRLLWFTDNPMQEFIDIKCPSARQFCTRFDDLREISELQNQLGD